MSRALIYEVIAVIAVTSEEAQNRLEQLLESVEQEPVVILRKGRSAVLLVSSTELDDLFEARQRSHAAAAFETWRTEAKEHLKPAAAALTEEEEIDRLVHELR
jgi:prevent-host-death family protein